VNKRRKKRSMKAALGGGRNENAEEFLEKGVEVYAEA
jgi:hypothetical protein